MAETAPTQTHPTEEYPTVEAPTEVINPSVSLDFDPTTGQLDKTKLLVRKVESDANLRGFEDLRGLDLTVHDDEGQQQRFVVLDGSTRTVNEPVRVVHGKLPDIQPIKIRSVKDAPHKKRRIVVEGGLAWNTKLVTHKKTGMPRLVKHAGRRALERDEEPVDPVQRKFVTFEEFDPKGNSLGVRTQRLSDFYAYAGSGLQSEKGQGVKAQPRAEWNWKRREGAQSVHEKGGLPIGLRRTGKEGFEEITDQLEAHNITNWTGLTWKLANPGKKDGGTGTDATKKGVPVRERTQTIIHDGAVKEPTYNGLDTRFARKFTLRTIERHADGSEVIVGDKTYSDYELWQYLEGQLHNADPKKPVIWDMRMPGVDTKTRAEFEKPENTYELPGHTSTNISIDTALNMLSSPELYPKNERGDEALQAHVKDLKKRNSDEVEYARELQRIVAKSGLGYLHSLIQKMHSEVYPMYSRSVERLVGVTKTPVEEVSASWILELLTKKSLENRKKGVADPFGAALADPHLLRDLTDEHLGEMFGHAVIKVKKVPVPGEIKDGEQRYTEKIVHTFNDDLFEVLPILGQAGDMDKVKEWRDRVWGPVLEVARDIYEASPSPDDTKNKPREVSDEEYRQLGRLLRRTIGE